ncbi:D-amino-acid chloroplastic-like [Micractinium conductrix]|uniref:D-amino-acid chloroplastic-like n=1 Tax=Micractinium conductrix TaxID=554055 RepID=A0A2P6V5N6_9CHLO|nr:D-amino-acid chloroplastic-like [Micractinium conductrix]|eukprot:PSC69405.1 D-amino-acid chloroplastic-like [Micractinium conductrix]
MVHRGHAVFDTAALTEGHVYQLDAHLQRFLTSAAKANIGLPRGMSVEQMRRTILETAAASLKLNGHIRYWLSAGRGGFGLSGSECLGPAFYCMVYTHEVPEEQLDVYLRGWRVKTSPVPVKAPFFANLKSTNYLPNALNLMDAQAELFDQGVFVDGAGNIAEGPNMNMACLLDDGTLVVPPFDSTLAGITIQRMMQLLPQAIEGGMEGIKRLEQRHISVEEAKGAREVFFVGSSLPVVPVVQWDERLIADGTAGLVALQIRSMLVQDAAPRNDSDQHTAVDYGYLTGMEP